MEFSTYSLGGNFYQTASWLGAPTLQGFHSGYANLFGLTSTSSTESSIVTRSLRDGDVYHELELMPILANYDQGIKIHLTRIPLKYNRFTNIPLNPEEDIVTQEFSSFPPGITNLGEINTVCSGGINPFGETPTVGVGQITTNEATYTDICRSYPATQCASGIDVSIGSNLTNYLVIYNMPEQSSGGYTFSIPSSCNLWCAFYDSTGTLSYSKNGFLQKITLKTFSFTCTLANGETVAGSGSY